VGVGFVEGTVVMGLVTWTGFRSWTMFGLPAQHNDCTLVEFSRPCITHGMDVSSIQK
jgi:hypothetical protein